MGQSPLAAAQIAAQVAEVREVNDGLCALFLPQQADAHGLAGGGGSSAARTDAIGIVFAERRLYLAAECACGGGRSAEWVYRGSASVRSLATAS
jgi:hypothetical protein